ncbi:class I SAM-dependent methyltransferase [Methylophilus flavus]|uniref:Class I SAM-dependent methyltransferase n=1 Tax=Methylophilus flavus TaxID=640084 RepID=A0ABW3P8B3_9PROT
MQPLYDTIGLSYSQTRCADAAITATLAELLAVQAQGDYLDLACGSGNYTLALAALAGAWHGVDISETMIRQASAHRASQQHPHHSSIHWQLGKANALPYANDFFDGVICTLAIHHFADLHQSFREVHRVMHEGRFVLFTAFPKQMRGYWLCHYFPQMMKRAIAQMPTEAAVTNALHAAGFEVERVVPFCVSNALEDLFLYSGKARPEQYLDPQVRANMSSFASLCCDTELAAGLQRLKQDIESGAFSQVADSYRIGQGDYAYVVARKSL